MKTGAVLLLLGTLAASTGAASDDLRAETFKAVYAWRGWLVATDGRRDGYWGGLAVAQVGVGRWGIAARGVVAGLPSEFDQNDPETFRSMELGAAVHANLWARQGFVLGAAFMGSKALAFETTPEGRVLASRSPGLLTAAVGARVAGQGGAVYLGIGTHETLGGLCAVGVAHLPLTRSLTVVLDGAVGANGQAFGRMALAVALVN